MGKRERKLNTREEKENGTLKRRKEDKEKKYINVENKLH